MGSDGSANETGARGVTPPVTPEMAAEGLPRGEMPPPHEPAFNVPAVLLVAIALMIAIHAALNDILPVDLANLFVARFAFWPEAYLAGSGAPTATVWLGPVTYSLLHGSWGHLGVNALWLVAFGTPLARRIGVVRFVLFWIASAVAAAFFHAAMTGFAPAILVGASGVVSATSGAICRFAIGQRGMLRANAAALAPRLGLFEALGRRAVLAFSALTLIANIALGFGFGTGGEGAAIAWQAHIGGFLFGIIAFRPFDPRP